MQTNYRSKLFLNFIALSFVQGANFILPLLVMPFVIKQIGIDGFGVVSVAHVVMIYLSTITDYGFNLTATRDVVLQKHDTEKISKIFFTVLATKFIISGFVLTILLILMLFVPFLQNHFLLYLLGFIYVIGQASIVNWIFQALEKMQYITLITLFSRLIFVLLVFIFIRKKTDDILFIFFLGLGNVIAGLLSIYLALRIFKLKFKPVFWNDIAFELKEGWQITVSNVSINTFLYVNVFILRLFTNDVIVGYYSVAEKIFFAMRQILAVFSQVIYPRVCQLVQGAKSDMVIFLKEFYVPFLILVVAGCTVVFIWSEQLVYLFLNARSDLSILLLSMLSFVPVIVCLNIPAYLILLALNQKKSYLRVYTIATVVNVVANLVLAKIWGPTGTVISIAITELLITFELNREIYRKKLFDFSSVRSYK